jgi:hypothetical protein
MNYWVRRVGSLKVCRVFDGIFLCSGRKPLPEDEVVARVEREAVCVACARKYFGDVKSRWTEPSRDETYMKNHWNEVGVYRATGGLEDE